MPEGTTPVGLPGVTLGLHDSVGSSFAMVLRHHDLTDPALWRMERLVAAEIRHAFGQPPAADETTMGAALDELGTALGHRAGVIPAIRNDTTTLRWMVWTGVAAIVIRCSAKGAS